MEKRASDRGLDAILTAPGRNARFADELGRRFIPTVDRLVAGAVEAGELRPDFSGQEVCFLRFMVGKVADITRESNPEVWRRCAQLLIDGTRPSEKTRPRPGVRCAGPLGNHRRRFLRGTRALADRDPRPIHAIIDRVRAGGNR
ncbi:MULTISPECIES: hypothetical protein [unclassified Microbacterium]|nr:MULTISPECIES: hypothetical protein [unclassified Microbacterium]MCR2808275.1 hypothetical protein [Microbacterium sp. zg.B185]WIM19270.1 hypothetical protein QNO12_00170 [Microbacterium sp. zg-B185]